MKASRPMRRQRMADGNASRRARRIRTISLLILMPLLLLFAATPAAARGGQQWFSAWMVSHGARPTTPVLAASSVRMILRPTISGEAVRPVTEPWANSLTSNSSGNLEIATQRERALRA